MGKALDVVEHDNRTRSIRKRRQRRPQPLAQLATLRRITERGRNEIRQLLRVPDLPPPCQVQGRIGYDPVQPGTESLRGIEPVKCLIRAQKPILNRILGVLMCQHNRPRNRIRTTLVQTHEAGKTPLISLFGETDELSLLVRNTGSLGQMLALGA